MSPNPARGLSNWCVELASLVGVRPGVASTGLDHCIEQGKYAAQQMLELDEKEAAERLACEERDIVTEAA